MDLFIISGVTRGLGKELSQRVLNKGDYLWAISRNIPKEFENSSNLIISKGDLLDENFIEELTIKIKEYDFSNFDRVFLINNAGLLGEIKRVEEISYKELKRTFEVNTFVPTILGKGLIENQSKVKKFIINITSGAGTRPIKEMSMYCSSKSALDMLTKIIALEYPQITTIAISPGMIETDMQIKLRSNGSEENKINYRVAKEEGKVRDSSFVAKSLIDYLTKSVIESGKIIHINDILS